MNFIKNFSILSIILVFLNSCGGKMPGADAKKFPPEPEKRVKKNLEEGRGFRLDTLGQQKGGTFDFASSNELWRASLDVIDFMPLTSANYSGGIIITDWYSDGSSNEAIKVTIRFLSNEVASNSLAIKIFYRKCDLNLSCKVSEKKGNLTKELMKKILRQAAIYEKASKDKNFKPYIITDTSSGSNKPKEN